MNFPVPSFPKIRMGALVIGFVIVCFLLGLVKHVFGAYPGDCVQIISVQSPRVSTLAPQDSMWPITSWGVFNEATGFYEPAQPIKQDEFVSSGTIIHRYHGGLGFKVYYSENNEWILHSEHLVSIYSDFDMRDSARNELLSKPTTLPSTCPCETERQAKITECGGAENIINWSYETCTGGCKPDCNDEYNALVSACDGQQYIKFFIEYNEDYPAASCYGECVGCGQVEQDCIDKGIDVSDSANYQCTDNGVWYPDLGDGGLELGSWVVTQMSVDGDCGYDSGFDRGGDPGDNGPPPEDPQPNNGKTCAELSASCTASCTNFDGVKSFTCDDVAGTHNCTCNYDGIPPPDGCVDNPFTVTDECPDDPPCVDDPATPEDECAGDPDPPCVDDPATPEDECADDPGCVDDPATPEDECAGDPDCVDDPATLIDECCEDDLSTSWNECCVDSPYTPLYNECTHQCIDDPATPEDECEGLPCVDNPMTPEDDCAPCVDDPSTPEDECSDPDNPDDPGDPGDPGDPDGDGDCVDDPNTAENECAKYEAVPGPASFFDAQYTVDSFNIGERFTGFIDNISETGVFALPDQFFSNLPGGGSPIIEFDAGSYGHQTVDLSEYNDAILILRAITMIVFSYLSIRVIILKR